MKKYKLITDVEAKPMTYGEYLKENGINLHFDIPEDTEGYTFHLLGYKQMAWVPKDVFEETFKPTESFLDRLKLEAQELGEKLSKLDKFINSDAFEDVAKESGELLKDQFEIMKEYNNILVTRILNLTEE